MNLAENFATAARKYAESIPPPAAPRGILLDHEAHRKLVMASYLSGAMQLAMAQAKADGAFPHPSRVIEAIESAGVYLLGAGSQFPNYPTG